jgi:hypothetical protein
MEEVADFWEKTKLFSEKTSRFIFETGECIVIRKFSNEAEINIGSFNFLPITPLFDFFSLETELKAAFECSAICCLFLSPAFSNLLLAVAQILMGITVCFIGPKLKKHILNRNVKQRRNGRKKQCLSFIWYKFNDFALNPALKFFYLFVVTKEINEYTAYAIV